MFYFLLAVFGIAAGALFVYQRKGEAAQVKTDDTANSVQPIQTGPVSDEAGEPQDLFDRIGGVRGVDPDLLRAVSFVESAMRADAVRWNPPYDVSVGMMQILCTPPGGTPQGSEYICQNRLEFADQWPTTFSALKDPELNVDIGAQILAWNIRMYSFPRGLAIYNNWAARHSGVNGPFPNDSYVNRVLARLKFLKGKRT